MAPAAPLWAYKSSFRHCQVSTVRRASSQIALPRSAAALLSFCLYCTVMLFQAVLSQAAHWQTGMKAKSSLWTKSLTDEDCPCRNTQTSEVPYLGVIKRQIRNMNDKKNNTTVSILLNYMAQVQQLYMFTQAEDRSIQISHLWRAEANRYRKILHRTVVTSFLIIRFIYWQQAGLLMFLLNIRILGFVQLMHFSSVLIKLICTVGVKMRQRCIINIKCVQFPLRIPKAEDDVYILLIWANQDIKTNKPRVIQW